MRHFYRLRCIVFSLLTLFFAGSLAFAHAQEVKSPPKVASYFAGGKPTIVLREIERIRAQDDKPEVIKISDTDDKTKLVFYPGDKLTFFARWENNTPFDIRIDDLKLKLNFDNKICYLLMADHDAKISNEEGSINWNLESLIGKAELIPGDQISIVDTLAPEPNIATPGTVMAAKYQIRLTDNIPFKIDNQDKVSFNQILKGSDKKEEGYFTKDVLDVVLGGEIAGTLIGPYGKPIPQALVGLIQIKTDDKGNVVAQDGNAEKFPLLTSQQVARDSELELPPSDQSLPKQLSDAEGRYILKYLRTDFLGNHKPALSTTYWNERPKTAFYLSDGSNIVNLVVGKLDSGRHMGNVLHFITQPINVTEGKVTEFNDTVRRSDKAQEQGWLYPTDPGLVEQAAAGAEIYSDIVIAKEYINEFAPISEPIEFPTVVNLAPRGEKTWSFNETRYGQIYLDAKHWSILSRQMPSDIDETVLHEFSHSIFATLVKTSNGFQNRLSSMLGSIVDTAKLPPRILDESHNEFKNDFTNDSLLEGFADFSAAFLDQRLFKNNEAYGKPWSNTYARLNFNGPPMPATSMRYAQEYGRTPPGNEEYAIAHFLKDIIEPTSYLDSIPFIKPPFINWDDPQSAKIILDTVIPHALATGPEEWQPQDRMFHFILEQLATLSEGADASASASAQDAGAITESEKDKQTFGELVDHMSNKWREVMKRDDLTTPFQQLALRHAFFTDLNANWQYDQSNSDENFSIGNLGHAQAFYLHESKLNWEKGTKKYNTPKEQRGSPIFTQIDATNIKTEFDLNFLNPTHESTTSTSLIGARPWRKLSPRQSGSYVQLKLSDPEKTDRLVDYQLVYAAPYDSFNTSYKVAYEDPFYINLPSPYYPSKLILSVDGSSSEPMVIDSNDYYTALNGTTASESLAIEDVKIDGGTPPVIKVDAEVPTVPIAAIEPVKAVVVQSVQPDKTNQVGAGQTLAQVQAKPSDIVEPGGIIQVAITNAAAPGKITVKLEDAEIATQTILGHNAVINVAVPQSAKQGAHSLTFEDALGSTTKIDIKVASAKQKLATWMGAVLLGLIVIILTIIYIVRRRRPSVIVPPVIPIAGILFLILTPVMFNKIQAANSCSLIPFGTSNPEIKYTDISNCSVFVKENFAQLPQGSSFGPYYEFALTPKGSPEHFYHFGRPELITFIQRLGYVEYQHSQELVINDMSMWDGRSVNPVSGKSEHAGHNTGNEVDLWVHKAFEANNISILESAGNYSPQQAQQFADEIKSVLRGINKDTSKNPRFKPLKGRIYTTPPAGIDLPKGEDGLLEILDGGEVHKDHWHFELLPGTGEN